GETNALSKTVTSNSVSMPQVSKGVNNVKVIAPGMFRISPDKASREAKKVPNTVSASSRTKPITVSQPSVITKKGINSNSNGLSSIGLDNTKTRRPQPRRTLTTYVLEILKKYGMESCDPVGTPMEIKDKLDLDQNGTLVDATKYRSMIGALILSPKELEFLAKSQ
nr:retrovirus-related Pol polyprotein from transposon TNT 1-94 [Tanacetum cinerariifolium]